jgi:uncharacterized RDD family membrane protein YckC
MHEFANMIRQCESFEGVSSRVKCPSCGFVSFPGLDRCKKCGHRFTQAESQKTEIPPLFSQPSISTAKAADAVFEGPRGEEQAGKPGSGSRIIDRGNAFPDVSRPSAAEANSSPDWQKALAERMQEYRRRRARIGKDNASEENTLDFGLEVEETASKPSVIEFPSLDKSDLGEDPSPDLDSDAVVLERLPDETGGESARPYGGQFSKNPSAPAIPMEIELEPSRALADASSVRIAPMSRRFLAGLLDLLVLLSAAGVFSAIFWQAGGRISPRPINLAVAAAVEVILLAAYFGAFTIFACGTPGLIWAGLEIRTFRGDLPRRIDCIWRSFGYLVSISALMLGFIWALVDGDGLTWHDRMSGTFLVRAQDWEAAPAAEPGSP